MFDTAQVESLATAGGRATSPHHGRAQWRLRQPPDPGTRGAPETRSSGAEGGPGKRAGRDPGTAPRSDPYIIGKGNKSQIATLVERTTRTVMLVRIPDDRNAERVAELLGRKMETLPEFLRNSVTWDQGKELARHVDFTVRTGMPVYFCDPTPRGNAAATRTPTGFSGSTSPRVPTCPCTRRRNLSESPQS